MEATSNKTYGEIPKVHDVVARHNDQPNIRFLWWER